MIEHSYVKTPAGDVHRAAELVHRTALEFIGRYRRWIGLLVGDYATALAAALPAIRPEKIQPPKKVPSSAR